jgi:hypothetical protein
MDSWAGMTLISEAPDILDVELSGELFWLTKLSRSLEIFGYVYKYFVSALRKAGPDEVKILKGIIPMCSYCHSIRNDEGAWDQMESYISKHSEVRYSHGICPKCYPKALTDAGLGEE